MPVRSTTGGQTDLGMKLGVGRRQAPLQPYPLRRKKPLHYLIALDKTPGLAR